MLVPLAHVGGGVVSPPNDPFARELKSHPLAATTEIELLAGLALNPDSHVRDPLTDLVARLVRETDHVASIACLGADSDRGKEAINVMVDQLTELHRVAKVAAELLRRERKASAMATEGVTQ